MKSMLFTIILLVAMSNKPLVNFNKDSNISNWKIVDDGVMGGLSEGKFTLTENGHAKFHGTVRLENNGGFRRFAIPLMQ